MSIDLSQFYEVFIDESFEGLETMESELLNLEPGDVDSEIINNIFRAAHSIKGGSGTFGFNAIANFTHVIETLLDEIRNGERALESNHVDLMLKSIDCLRNMLAAIQNNAPQESEEANELRIKFENILNSDNTSQPSPENQTDSNSAAQPEAQPDESPHKIQLTNFFEITFVPEPHVFKTGNEPLFIFEDLREHGELSVQANINNVPELSNLIPDDCYLGWTISLDTTSDEEAIKSIFEWVEDDAEISIKLVAQFGDEVAPDEEVNATAPPAPPRELDTVTEPVVSTSKESTPEELKNKPISDDKNRLKDGDFRPVNTKPSVNKNESTKQESSSIRVGTDKVDSLINMVGELVITQAMLNELGEGEDFDHAKLLALREGLAQLAHNTRDLQENVMRIRMLPISFVFSRFPRLVRDISQKLDKQVDLVLKGEGTELDKTVMEKISDPMVHLIRNSLDHGLETTAERIAAGKGEVGQVILNAYHQGGNIVIEIIDDGRGLNTEKIKSKAIQNGLIPEDANLSDQEINELIFQPGFSTADEVSDISGRGVGMDVVKRNINALNGSVEVVSEPGFGSTFTIRLPLTLAILDGQLVKVGDHIYIIPLVSIVESLQIDIRKVNSVGGGIDVLRLREEYIPILRMHQLFNHPEACQSLKDGLLVVVESDNEKVGLLVDELLAQQQFVIKSLEDNYKKVDGISGATILGSGSISLIIDISSVVKMAGLKKAGQAGLDFEKPLSEAV
ncbi:chemotaxis protein CheA [Psychrosphaera aestuarii]|uniref:chemotaxis protein CheA n=1 Tax=Psychrosphaera aestuarii TaxID=1266052 RepID=UPI001B341CB0|nr:chemotaxis protein CheA [Psychrosphaera aestuarii]